jgi:hypothetical protein
LPKQEIPIHIQNRFLLFFLLAIRRSTAVVLPLKNFPRKHAFIGNGENSGVGGGG